MKQRYYHDSSTSLSSPLQQQLQQHSISKLAHRMVADGTTMPNQNSSAVASCFPFSQKRVAFVQAKTSPCHDRMTGKARIRTSPLSSSFSLSRSPMSWLGPGAWERPLSSPRPNPPTLFWAFKIGLLMCLILSLWGSSPPDFWRITEDEQEGFIDPTHFLTSSFLSSLDSSTSSRYLRPVADPMLIEDENGSLKELQRRRRLLSRTQIGRDSSLFIELSGTRGVARTFPLDAALVYRRYSDTRRHLDENEIVQKTLDEEEVENESTTTTIRDRGIQAPDYNKLDLQFLLPADLDGTEGGVIPPSRERIIWDYSTGPGPRYRDQLHEQHYEMLFGPVDGDGSDEPSASKSMTTAAVQQSVEGARTCQKSRIEAEMVYPTCNVLHELALDNSIRSGMSRILEYVVGC